MKMSLFCLVSLCTISILCARDITTLDGITYKNVTIVNSSPVGITITYKRTDGTTVIRGLDFMDLPEDIRKEFNYSDARAEEFEKRALEYRDMLYKDGLKKAWANAAANKQAKADLKQIDQIQTFLISQSKYIRFKAIRAHKNGLIGYASSADRTVTTGSYGIIFLEGIGGSNGTYWSGYIYPTDRSEMATDGTYAVYNSSLEQAVAEAVATLKQY